MHPVCVPSQVLQVGSQQHSLTVWSLWTQLLFVLEGPVKTVSIPADELPVFEWWTAQLEKLCPIVPSTAAKAVAPDVKCTAAQRSTLLQIVQVLDSWVACAIAFTRRHAVPTARRGSNVLARYGAQHKLLRTLGISLYLNVDDSANVLNEIYQPALDRVNQCSLVHIEIGAARNIALHVMNFLHAIGLSHLTSLGFVLCPDSPQNGQIIMSDQGQGVTVETAAGATPTLALTVIRTAQRSIRQVAAFGPVYPHVSH